MFCLFVILFLLVSRRRYFGGYGYPYGYGNYPYGAYGYGAYGYGGYPYPYGAYSMYNPYFRQPYGYYRPHRWWW